MRFILVAIMLVWVAATMIVAGPARTSRPIKASYHERALENLLDYSTAYLDPKDDLWKPAGGDRIHLSRLILPEGGFVEFSLPVSGAFFFFDKSDYRSAKSFIRRKQHGESAQDYLATGFEFAYTQDPGPDETMGFGQSFIPPIVALLLEGPCLLENLVYDEGRRP